MPSVIVAFLTSQALIINDLALTHDSRILGHYDEIKIEAQKQGVRVWCWDTAGKSFSNTPSHSWNWLGGSDTPFLNASSSEKQQKQENIYCIFVEPEYDGTLSSGQGELYQALLELQQTTVYAVVIVEQLMNKLGLKTPMPVLKRLENLQYLKAISGLKV
ncbi:hypothetical protein D0962_09370 [Leptolyngbyaceae cyanobacterium CCMR0082]|uniref:Uncharacterized protein n=1 Tax=Adonisia turfae CCMR0082 TaxID=2304604 RepID=A0A6M0S3U3_9CYAN|nr:hypothetical protein [Adonisia turfae CCMR0082]